MAGDLEDADRDRLALLFAEHSLALTRFAVRRVGDSAAADVVSEVFLIAWRRRRDITWDNPLPWLFGTAANVIQQEVRGTRRRWDLQDRVEREPGPTEVDDPAGEVTDRLLVRQTLAQMSERDQEVLRLAEWERLSLPDIAAVLESSVATVRVRLHRARRRFAERLARAQADRAQADRPAATQRSTDDYTDELLTISRPVEERGGAQ